MAQDDGEKQTTATDAGSYTYLSFARNPGKNASLTVKTELETVKSLHSSVMGVNTRHIEALSYTCGHDVNLLRHPAPA